MVLKKYTNDYELVETVDEHGHEKNEVVYRGDYFEVSLDEKGLRVFKRLCVLIFFIILIIHLYIGFIESEGMRQMYISMPYVFAFIPLYFLATAILQLPVETRRFTRKEIDLSFHRIKIASYAMVILIGIGVFGEIIFLFLSTNQGPLILELQYLVLEAVSAFLLYSLIHKHKAIHIEKSKDQQSDDPAKR